MNQATHSATRQIARAAGTVMAAFILSNLIGLVRNILIYRTFGTSAELDAFNAANRVTEVLFNLMAGGVLGSAFIPTFTGFLAKEKTNEAWRLASAVTNLLLLFLSLAAALAAIFAPQVVRYGLYVLLPGEALAQEALTINLLRLMLPTVVIFGLSGLAMGILNAHRRFWLPAIAPAMYSLGLILGVWLFPQDWGVYRLAAGAVLGALLHLGLQIPALQRLSGHRYTPTLGRGQPAVGEVLRLMGPRIFGVAVVQLNFVINTAIALSLPEGSVSAIVLAFSLMLMPQVAIAQSIAIASLPTFSAQVAQGQTAEMRASLAQSLRGALLLSLPAAVGLILLGRPLIRLLYEDGVVFSARSTELVAWALLWYTLGLVSHAVVEIVSRAFYALHDTKTPVVVGAAAMALNVLLSFALVPVFNGLGYMPHGGLALANTTATTLEMAGLLWLMRRRLEGIGGRSIGTAVIQGTLGSAVMGGALLGWLALSRDWPGWLVVSGGMGLGGVIYLLMLALQRVAEVRLAWETVRRRLVRRSALPGS